MFGIDKTPEKLGTHAVLMSRTMPGGPGPRDRCDRQFPDLAMTVPRLGPARFTMPESWFSSVRYPLAMLQ
jgi:hypothetical protein